MMNFNANRALLALVLLTSLSLFAACSDDTSGGEKVEQCLDGEFYNALSGHCELRGRDGDNDPSVNNNPADAGHVDEADADDSPHGDAVSEDVSQEADTSVPDDTGVTPTPPDTVTPDECGPGEILGKACAPSGSVLSGATVTLEGFDCDGQPFTRTTQTNREGEYSFSDVPAGQHTVTVTIGSYSGDQQVRVSAGQTTDLTTAAAKICLEAANVQIAVIQGAYDKVEALLDDLQLTYDIKGNDQGGSVFLPSAPASTVAFLSDLSAMQQYDIIFINCGQLWNSLTQFAPGSVSPIINNLVAYLNSGGSLYSSDWAHAFVETAFPDMIDFYGDDATTEQALFGYAPQTITATVMSQPLQVALGHNTTSIDFPHSPPLVLNNNWAVAEGVGLQATVHLQGTVQLCASTSSCTSPGASIVDAPLLISHVTPGGGTVFFTSFHNESQGGISQDMEEILKFLIFQL